MLLLLRISGTTLRQACSRHLRRCVAQLGPTTGVVKPGGGMSKWKKPLLSSGKLSRYGRLVKALRHHTMRPNIASYAVHHTPQEAAKEVYENTDPKSSEVYRLDKQLRRENNDDVGVKPVKNDAGQTSMSKKAEGLVRGLPKASQH